MFPRHFHCSRLKWIVQTDFGMKRGCSSKLISWIWLKFHEQHVSLKAFDRPVVLLRSRWTRKRGFGLDWSVKNKRQRTVPAVTPSSHFLPVLQLSINDANEMRSLTHFEISLNEKVPRIKVNCDVDCWAEPLVCPRITVSITWEALGCNRGYESICAGPWNQQAVMRICSTWETKLCEREQ